MDRDLRSAHASANGVRLHYVAAGKPGNPLLLFLHGFPEHCLAWRDILPAFSADHYAVAVDLPGYNLSDISSNVADYRAGVVARTLAAFVQALGYRDCILVGHDWGGAIGWYMAATRPEMIRAYVAINAVHPLVFAREYRESPAQRAASAYIGLFRQPDAESRLAANDFAYLLDMLGDDAGRPAWLTEARRAEYQQAWRRPGALSGGLGYYRATPATTSGASEAPVASPPSAGSSGASEHGMNVDVPVLVIWGEKDKFLLPGNLQGLEAYVRQLQVVRLPDATHWVVHEQPARICDLIQAFVRQQAPAAPATQPSSASRPVSGGR